MLVIKNPIKKLKKVMRMVKVKVNEKTVLAVLAVARVTGSSSPALGPRNDRALRGT